MERKQHFFTIFFDWMFQIFSKLLQQCKLSSLQCRHLADALIQMLKIGAIIPLSHRLLAALQPVSEGIHAHRGMQAFANVTLGPYRWKMEQAPVWLSSGPHSGLSKLIIVIHSCDQYLTASWQTVLAQHTPSSVFTGKKSHREIKAWKTRSKNVWFRWQCIYFHLFPFCWQHVCNSMWGIK